MEVYHQGDLLIVPVNEKPVGEHAEDKTGVILEGEVTGHQHMTRYAPLMRANKILNEGNDYYAGYIEAEKEVPIEHLNRGTLTPTGDHKIIEVPAQFHKFYAQREWDELEAIRARD